MAASPPGRNIGHYYTPKYGMFAKMQIKVQRTTGNQYSTELKALSTHLDVFKYIQNLPSVRDVIQLPDDETLNGKNPDVAKTWRQKGNALFAKNSMKQAILMYNMCILHAPLIADPEQAAEGTGELALGFANRSAAFYHLNKHEECLKDIKWSLARGYPAKLRYKLYERQGNSLRELGRYTEAREAFRKALAVLNQAQLLPEIAEKFADRVQTCLASCEGKPDKKPKSKTPEVEAAGNDVTVMSDPDSLYPDQASSCEVRESPEKGLYVVAKETIKPGDVIIKERPYAWTVEPDYKHTYCHHCMSRFTSAVPCMECNVALFCNEECMVRANKYHKYECPCLSVIMEDSIGTCTTTHLAFRVIAITGLETILKHKKFLDKSLELNEQDHRARMYDLVYRQPSHSEKRKPADLLERGLIAVFLLRCLDRAKFFENVEFLLDDANTTIDDVKDYVGGLLLRHLQSVAITAFSINELQVNRGARLDDQSQTSTMVIGGAVHSTKGLLSHACDENTNHQNALNTMSVVRAQCTIQPGQEVTTTYGPNPMQSSKAERQAWLKRKYRFTCACAACTEDWPSMMILVTAKPTWKCQSCAKPLTRGQTGRTECKFCHKQNDIRAMNDKFTSSLMKDQMAAHNILNVNYQAEKALPILYKHLRVLESLVCKPSVDMLHCQEAIPECYRVLGNFHIRD